MLLADIEMKDGKKVKEFEGREGEGFLMQGTRCRLVTQRWYGAMQSLGHDLIGSELRGPPPIKACGK